MSLIRPRSPAALAVRSLCLGALVACSPSAPAPAPPSPALSPAANRPAAEVETIHHALLIPGSEVLYSVESAPPTVASAWASVQEGAAKVAQGAEQLAEGRGAADSWRTLASQLGEAARASASASASANPDELRSANEKIAAACTGCHQAFPKPKP